MLAGELYDAGDPELVAERTRCEERLRKFNAAAEEDERVAVLRELLGSFGAGSQIRAPFFCDYGYNIQLGAAVFLNFNCVVLDVVPVTIGDRTQIASAVQILAADHPTDLGLRRSGVENGRPVTIGADVWIGAGAILCPGVKVGDGSVIGAGSVVTGDIQPGVVAFGNPCRAVRSV